jgi:hypothetical protein
MRDHEPFSVEAAQRAAERGELAEWVRRFLASPGSDNAPLAEELTTRHTCWTGPVEVPISRLHRLAGPPEDPVLCPVEDDFWDDRVDDMAERIEDDGWTPTPVIASYRDGDLVLEDGNHRAESLRRAGEDRAWAVVGFEHEADRAAFDPPRRRPT